MNSWTEKFESHDIHDGIVWLYDELDSITEILPDYGAEPTEDVLRLKETLALLERRLSLADPNLVPEGPLNRIWNSIQSAHSEIKNFQSNKNPGHLKNAAAQADQILDHTSKIITVNSNEDLETIRDSITSFRRSAGQNLRYFEEDSKSLKSQFDSLSKQLRNLEGEINSQKGRLDTAISEFQKQFSEAEQSRRQTSSSAEEKRNEQFKELLDEGQDSLDGVREQHIDKFSSLLEGLSASAETIRSKAIESSKNLLIEIKDEREQAAKLVKIIADTGLIGGYQKVADKERNSARLWHAAAILSMSGLIGFAIYAFTSTLDGDVKWDLFASKIFVSLAFGIAAAYAAKQADKHQQIERKNRKMELELAAVGPYLKDFPEELQQKIKEQLASRLFGQSELDDQSRKDKLTGTTADLLKLALDSINSMSKS